MARLTAVELQWEFLRLAQKYADEIGLECCGGDDVGGDGARPLGARARRRSRRDPIALDGQLDWVTKLSLLEAYVDRDGLEWDDPKLRCSTCSTTTCGPTGRCTSGWCGRARSSAWSTKPT